MTSKLRSKIWVLALMSATTFSTVAFADHLPPRLQARGIPEKRLAGILLDHSKIADVIKMYGKPSEVNEQPKSANLNDVDTYDYYWRRVGSRLHLLVYRGSGIKGGEYIALIEVEGSQAKGKFAQTGAGLKIGDSLTEWKRIYGRRFKERNIPKLNIHDVMVQWQRVEFSLVAELDGRGRIRKLSLSPPE